MMRLNESNYYSLKANQQMFSPSQIKALHKCPAMAMAEINGDYVRPMTQALTVGQYVDEALTGDLQAWLAQHPEILKKDGTPRAEYVQAQEMVDRAKRDTMFMSFLAGKHQEIITGKLFGQYPFKGKLDCLQSNRIVDLKTVKDMQPVYVPGQGRVDFATAWDWPLQLAIYQELYRMKHKKRLPCYLAVITKESPADIAIIQVEQERLDAELGWLEQEMPRFEAIKAGIIEPERCEHCAYCRETKILTGPVSLSEYEEDIV